MTSNLIDVNALFKITYGLYIVSSKYENKLNGYISNTVMQVTSDPVQFAIWLSGTEASRIPYSTLTAFWDCFRSFLFIFCRLDIGALESKL